MTNSHHNPFVAGGDGTIRLSGRHRNSPPADRFVERIGAFEQGGTPDPAGINNFLRLAAADLFRTMPLIERAVVTELREAFEDRLEPSSPALRQYVQTLPVLRGALQASVALETQIHPSAPAFPPQTMKQDQL